MSESLEKNENSNINLSYENLPQFEENTNYIELMRKVTLLLKETEEKKWNECVEGINYLRRLRKYNKEVFEKIMYDLDIFNIILSYLNCSRTILSKITLVFIQEIFSEYEFEYNEKDEEIELVKFIEFITPKLISKVNSDKSFIKEEVIKCLKNLSENMTYGKTLITLIKCFLENENCDLCYKFIEELLNNFDVNYLIYFDYWNELFEILIKTLKMNKELFTKKCISIINLLEKLLGKENYNKILNENCSEEEKELIKISNNNLKDKTNQQNKLNDKKCIGSEIGNLIKESRNKLKQMPQKEILVEVFTPKNNLNNIENEKLKENENHIN